VLGQDLETGEDGVFRIARRVAKDRVISTVDPDARHGHKTSARGFDGYKGHAAVDPDSEIITATTVTPGNAGDASFAEDLIADLLDSTRRDDDKPGQHGPEPTEPQPAEPPAKPPTKPRARRARAQPRTRSGRASTATTPTAGDRRAAAPPQADAAVLRGDGVPGVSMTAVVSPAGGRVRVFANLGGVRAGERCEVVVLRRDERREVAPPG
jgi:hypothetical protein